ncbi:bacteriophage antitermination protein Q [Enterobacter hormaechei]|uniref:bacteriophage antitermination protein Q n=1 Tax=Enterobacter hormaechei TaxID=158836 RepID=UPI0010053392|nr:bacteriophage antitermination protein Q [Enterobacter hormaechei]MCC9329348.1 bacteriophage antitermination protein Q [Enterobacter hormaechei subsp. steigerwaltii]MCC9335115.1 bacteriophage antitermination protein Q [Enterobacter hormaechei subsp. steigerwaltii]MCC9344846.1 bacteriophage antitermination protein Q [Enterobacter hormaechei subsp. steigerwaltii]MCC9349513.1 bacteriophage antitermination protein Q [Enterobacter hormaechei subsp. steigerwaltii]MCC9354536.1 bacteriophage antiter
MNSQQLEYVRQQLIVATADLSGATKGQLLAWLENAQFDTKTFKRKKPRVMDEVTGEMVTLDNPPIPGKQSRAKGSHIPLVNHVEFCTASWRRALMSLEEHQKAWLLWNYSENIRFEYQVAITQWAWSEFREQLGTKKVAGKTMERLKKLIWLAAQDVKAELSGRETYEYQALASLVGVTPKNWSETFTDRWVEMRRLFLRLDSGALLQVTRSRSQQKATNLDSSLAKLD